MTRALLITNRCAARAHARAVATIRDILQGGGWSVEVRSTNGPGDARRIAEESRGMGFDVLVSHGGDGTAMQVAAGIAGTGIALGLVPGGTGNVLAGEPPFPAHPPSSPPPPPAPPPQPSPFRRSPPSLAAQLLVLRPRPGVALPFAV